MPPAPRPPALDCWYLTGPTAAGKTKVGIELAERIDAEIISLDSMAVYQGMDIGTAKPTAADRARVRHHLLDLVPPTEDFSLSDYIDAAHAAIADIKARGREVLFVGGTPLYLKALLRGVYQGPPADWEFRAAIDRELETLPLASLHQRLQLIDPLLAAKLHPHDKRRIIRGLEVFKLTGQRLSHLQTHFDEGHPASAVKAFVLAWPRDELHQRIDARVEQMFAAGLVAEVQNLIAQHGHLSRTALQAVGYREILNYLQSRDQWSRKQGRGEGTKSRSQETGDREQNTVEWAVPTAVLASAQYPALSTQYSVPSTPVPTTPPTSPTSSATTQPRAPSPEPQSPLPAACADRVKIRTHQFARRQETWFRAISECTFVPMKSEFGPAATATHILHLAETLAQGQTPQ